MKELDTKYIAILVSVCITLILAYPYIVYTLNWLIGVR